MTQLCAEFLGYVLRDAGKGVVDIERVGKDKPREGGYQSLKLANIVFPVGDRRDVVAQAAFVLKNNVFTPLVGAATPEGDLTTDEDEAPPSKGVFLETRRINQNYPSRWSCVIRQRIKGVLDR